MRIVHNDEVCEVSADDFWSLRMDTGFDRFIAEGDKQIWSRAEAEEPAGADGAVAMRRHTKLNFKENPVPSWLRGALGGGSDFSFKVTAHFYPTLYDEAIPVTRWRRCSPSSLTRSRSSASSGRSPPARTAAASSRASRSPSRSRAWAARSRN